jgi:serine/threonine protein kinase
MEEEEKISEDKAQDDEPETIQTTSPKNNVPSRRRIILFNNRNTNSQHNNLLPPNLLQDKHYMAQHATTSTGKSRYAIKIISPHILHDTKKYLQACADMATETYFFSILHHENIVQLRAVGQDDMFSPSYFLIMDRLYDTLLQRIEGVWRQKMDRLENDFWVWNRGKKCSGFWMERLGVGRSLAGALGYLHDLGIIYRDLVSVMVLLFVLFCFVTLC